MAGGIQRTGGLTEETALGLGSPGRTELDGRRSAAATAAAATAVGVAGGVVVVGGNGAGAANPSLSVVPFGREGSTAGQGG